MYVIQKLRFLTSTPTHPDATFCRFFAQPIPPMLFNKK